MIWPGPESGKDKGGKTMKKILALMLVLCMALAAIPAMAEDFSGTWYWNLADVTFSTFELKADGTYTADLAGQTAEGTWTADDASVTIDVMDASVVFTWDGTALTAEGLSAQLCREPAKLTYGNALYVMDPETEGAEPLPEGMTQEDAEAIVMNFATEFIAFADALTEAAAAPGTDEPAPGNDEPAPDGTGDADLTVVNESFIVTQTYSRYEGNLMLKLQNNTDTPLFITDGNFVLKGADGSELASKQSYYPCGSEYVEPGEITVVTFSVDIDDPSVVAGYEYALETKTESWRSTDTIIPVDSTEFVDGGEYDSKMRATITNNSDQPLANIQIVFVLEDAEGSMLYTRSDGMYAMEIGPGSTITFVPGIDSDVLKFCAENGITPAQVEAFAYVSNSY